METCASPEKHYLEREAHTSPMPHLQDICFMEKQHFLDMLRGISDSKQIEAHYQKHFLTHWYHTGVSLSLKVT